MTGNKSIRPWEKINIINNRPDIDFKIESRRRIFGILLKTDNYLWNGVEKKIQSSSITEKILFRHFKNVCGIQIILLKRVGYYLYDILSIKCPE